MQEHIGHTTASTLPLGGHLFHAVAFSIAVLVFIVLAIRIKREEAKQKKEKS